VGIYIGDSRFIHASHVVRINSFDREQPDFYNRKPLCFRRILGQQDLPDTGVLSVKNSPYYVLLP
jgi:cell wall-associated NlpC family hydrolase